MDIDFDWTKTADDNCTSAMNAVSQDFEQNRPNRGAKKSRQRRQGETIAACLAHAPGIASITSVPA
jgi:hypothetical protein